MEALGFAIVHVYGPTETKTSTGMIQKFVLRDVERGDHAARIQG
jgi:hypothetical protein